MSLITSSMLEPVDSWTYTITELPRTMRKMRRELDRALDTFWEPYQSNYGRLGSDRSQCASPLTDLYA
ncbi:hypothetical protein HMI56_005948 [Coelomomyces lativittatus]|nr:hypothetical protein HMI56_005948 [Coelomomyces lativittatus]